MGEKPLRFTEWEETVHPTIRNGPLWQFKVYPKAMFVYDLAWFDCGNLLRDERGKTVARQLVRSAGAISANIEEGFGRSYGKDYAYHLRIAMGETRESQGRYWHGRHLFTQKVLDHRLPLLNEIIAMLVPNLTKQRNYTQ